MKMHNEELHNLFPSSNLIRTVTLMRLRYGEKMLVEFWWEIQKERDK
jgi:hypothetical protein